MKLICIITSLLSTTEFYSNEKNNLDEFAGGLGGLAPPPNVEAPAL